METKRERERDERERDATTDITHTRTFVFLPSGSKKSRWLMRPNTSQALWKYAKTALPSGGGTPKLTPLMPLFGSG